MCFDADSSNIIFTIKYTKLYVPVVTLSAKDNQKLSKLLSEGFERSVCCNKYKTKSEDKSTTNECRYFLESNFVGVNRLFVLIYSNHNNNAKMYKTRRYYLPKGVIKLVTSSSMEKKLLWSTNCLRRKKIRRNDRVNN